MASTEPIVWLPDALEDLERILTYPADDPPALYGLFDQVFGAVSRLAIAPYLGRAGRWPGTRELRAAPGYTLAYRAREGRVESWPSCLTMRRGLDLQRRECIIQ